MGRRLYYILLGVFGIAVWPFFSLAYQEHFHFTEGNQIFLFTGTYARETILDKRDDRVYGRPYFAFVREDGSTTKAFVLPQRNPEAYRNSFKSYNIPEFYDTPEPYSAWDVRDFYFDIETEKMSYRR